MQWPWSFKINFLLQQKLFELNQVKVIGTFRITLRMHLIVTGIWKIIPGGRPWNGVKLLIKSYSYSYFIFDYWCQIISSQWSCSRYEWMIVMIHQKEFQPIVPPAWCTAVASTGGYFWLMQILFSSVSLWFIVATRFLDKLETTQTRGIRLQKFS